MKRLLPLLPAVALLIQLDRAGSRPPADHVNDDLPAVVRALPARDEGRFHRSGDPLNLVFVGSKAAVREALSSAGWTEIPRGCADSFFAGLEELWLGRPLRSFPPCRPTA